MISPRGASPIASSKPALVLASESPRRLALLAQAGIAPDAVRAAGIDAIVLETDCPYLAPIPMRGKRNEPAYVSYTLAKLAEVLEMDRDAVLARTDRNAASLFGL